MVTILSSALPASLPPPSPPPSSYNDRRLAGKTKIAGGQITIAMSATG